MYLVLSPPSICSLIVETVMVSTTPTPYNTALFICWKQNTSQRRQSIIIPCLETEIQLLRNETTYPGPFSWNSSRARWRSQSPCADVQCKPLTLSTPPPTSVEQVMLHLLSHRSRLSFGYNLEALQKLWIKKPCINAKCDYNSTNIGKITAVYFFFLYLWNLCCFNTWTAFDNDTIC